MNHVHFTVASDAHFVISQLDALSVIWVIMDQHVKMLVVSVNMVVTSQQGCVFLVTVIVVTA